MTSCPSCALPCSVPSDRCSFCGVELFGVGPLLARFDIGDNGITLASSGRELVSAVHTGGMWRLLMPSNEQFGLVMLGTNTASEAVLFDEDMNLVASFESVGSSLVVRDGSEKMIAILRRDCGSGTQLASPEGTALLYSGRSRSNRSASDLFITEAGTAMPLVILMAAMVADHDQLSWIAR